MYQFTSTASETVFRWVFFVIILCINFKKLFCIYCQLKYVEKCVKEEKSNKCRGKKKNEKKNTSDGTRTRNPRLRRPMPYPLGYGGLLKVQAVYSGFIHNHES